MSNHTKWEKHGQKLLADIAGLNRDQKIAAIKRANSKLPEAERILVDHYITAMFVAGLDESIEMKNSTNNAIIIILSIVCASGVAMFCFGLWLQQSSLSASSDIAFWKFHVKTESVGVGLLALSVILIFFSVRELSKKIR